ncbi:hypothetical protein GV828_10810 [Flavobacterium sp. NST-5]|uniref:Uncharacterized protein n=1 Tax=Flavobacterium ichthyis TaxID=2698827 RepID=A0ABW9Z9X5_9FLAO|nr:hypothetical protein [Flavobacterium ichthyis]NBL65691.1 hypothetical protein [Flavobacterium ichthyis]
MKKTIFLLCLSMATTTVFAQKKGTKKAVSRATSNTILAKSGEASVQVSKDFFYFSNNGKDTIGIKKVSAATLPKDCAIKPFTAKGVSLYQITWAEETTTKTDLKTEIRNSIFSHIINPATKEKLFSSESITTHITEKVFLDKLKNASETQQRIRREGFELEVTADGDLIQKNKTQQNNFVFSETDKKYVSGKTTSVSNAKPKPTAKKNKA